MSDPIRDGYTQEQPEEDTSAAPKLKFNFADVKPTPDSSSLEAARQSMRQAMKERDFDARLKAGYATTRASSGGYVTYENVPSRTMQTNGQKRRQLGDECRVVDYPGYWINIRFNRQDEPVRSILFEVSADMSQYRCIVEDETQQEWRAIERLPKQGIFIYIF